MHRFIILFAAVLATVAATSFQQCGDGKPAPKALRVKGCDAPPCKVVKGGNADVEIDFTVENDASALTTKVMATAAGITIPYNLPEEKSNVCKNLLDGSFCPLDASEDATYQLLFPIASIYPEITVGLEMTIVDQDDSVVACFSVDIQVVKP